MGLERQIEIWGQGFRDRQRERERKRSEVMGLERDGWDVSDLWRDMGLGVYI